MFSSLKLLLLALQNWKACDLESVSYSKHSALQKHTDSIISGIEIIEENIPDGSDKLQSERFKNTKLNLQSNSFTGWNFRHMPNMFQMYCDYAQVAISGVEKLSPSTMDIYIHTYKITVEEKYY